MLWNFLTWVVVNWAWSLWINWLSCTLRCLAYNFNFIYQVSIREPAAMGAGHGVSVRLSFSIWCGSWGPRGWVSEGKAGVEWMRLPRASWNLMSWLEPTWTGWNPRPFLLPRVTKISCRSWTPLSDIWPRSWGSWRCPEDKWNSCTHDLCWSWQAESADKPWWISATNKIADSFPHSRSFTEISRAVYPAWKYSWKGILGMLFRESWMGVKSEKHEGS